MEEQIGEEVRASKFSFEHPSSVQRVLGVFVSISFIMSSKTYNKLDPLSTNEKMAIGMAGKDDENKSRARARKNG